MNHTPPATNKGGSILRFSTEMFAPRYRLAAWREFIGRGVFKFDIQPYSGGGFSAQSTVRILPGLRTIESIATASRHDRPGHMVSDDDFLFGIARAGTSRFAGSGREAVVGVGDAVLMGGGESGLKDSLADGRFIYLQVPKRAIASSVIGLGDSICRRIPADTPALRLLQHYVSIIDDPDAAATPELQRLIVTHIHDLVALTIGATRDAAEVAKARGGQAARLHAIIAAIEQHLVNPELSAAWLGVQLGLSDRYVHHLLAGGGLSFSELVRGKRVELARKMLEDSSAMPRRIIDVAYAVGFGDLSNFNRAFRQRFGCTPSDVLYRR